MLIVLVQITGVPVDKIDDEDYDDHYHDSTESKMWQGSLPHKKYGGVSEPNFLPAAANPLTVINGSLENPLSKSESF